MLVCSDTRGAAPFCEVTFSGIPPGVSVALTIEVANTDFSGSDEYISSVLAGSLSMGSGFLASGGQDNNCGKMDRILDDVQVLIDRGRGAIRLATDGHSIRVFVRRASDYLIGGTYEVPSGLGGTFRVILKDACDTFAIVQNCGNCEDFDAMQPYRVPLDALMEIDDRRVA